nr:phosphoribosyltransferase [Lactiplantibacillus pentosus]
MCPFVVHKNSVDGYYLSTLNIIDPKLTTPTDITGQSILIVDDIYTTGRTIRHAASLLLENGAKSVTGLTLAR